MIYSMQIYIDQSTGLPTNPPLSDAVNSSGFSQADYISQSFSSGLLSNIIATLNSMGGSSYIDGTQPVLYSNKSVDILSGDPQHPVYIDMRDEAQSYVDQTPGAFTIDTTEAAEYLNSIQKTDLRAGIDELNEMLVENNLPKLSVDQEWIVEQTIWRVASENMMTANIDAGNTNVKAYAGTGVNDGSVMLQNEVSTLINRGVGAINGEAVSNFISDPSAELISTTPIETRVYTSNGTVVTKSTPIESDTTITEAIADAPSLSPSIRLNGQSGDINTTTAAGIQEGVSEIPVMGSGGILGPTMGTIANVGYAFIAEDLMASSIKATIQAAGGHYADAGLTMENSLARAALGIAGAELGAELGGLLGTPLGLPGQALGAAAGAVWGGLYGASEAEEAINILNEGFRDAFEALKQWLLDHGGSESEIYRLLNNTPGANSGDGNGSGDGGDDGGDGDGGAGGNGGGAGKWGGSYDDARNGGPGPSYDPLILDLTGAGIQTTKLSNGVFFNGLNNGFKQLTAWTGANTGILVYDPTGGPILNGSQMFGTSYSLSGGGFALDGFAALADLDSNSDGAINSSDAHWGDLRVWVDANSNGITDTGEIKTMSNLGIASFSLTTTSTNSTDANGNLIGKTASYSLTGGGTREVADVSFLTAPQYSVADTIVGINSDIGALPNVQGYGIVTSLRQAMQIQLNDGDDTLEGYVQDFVDASDDATRNTLVDEIIFQWTGVQDVSSTARGSYFDARKLEALERFNGQNFVDPYNSTSNPDSKSVAVLTVAYQQLHDYILAGLESQTNLESMFNDLNIAFDAGTMKTWWDFSDAEAEILNDLSANRAEGLAKLVDFNRAIYAWGMSADEGYATFRDELVAEGADIAATFFGGSAVVNGTAGDDVITAWAGNQTIIASQGGNDTLIGSGDNETFYGSGGSNLFIGGVGDNEYFFGGSNGGTDTFISGQGTQSFSEGWRGLAIASYAAGSGNLTLQDDAGDGTLVLGSSVDRLDVSITAFVNSTVITDGVSGDTITLLRNGLSGFETLAFADGTTLNMHVTGGTHNATSGSTLTGNWRDDIYEYNPGTGHVTLSDTGGNNELWLGGTVTSSNLSFSLSGSDLVITDGVSGDQIIDKNFSVQTIRFADGSTMNAFQLGSTYTLSGATTATGGGVSDTYSFASGTGTATISDPGGSNTLAFGSGITAASLTFTGSGNDLLITDGVSGDEIVILGQLGGQTVIQTLRFSTGSPLSLTTGLALHEASGGTSLNGTSGADTMFGNSGSHTLNGNGGNDIFINGSGNTTINAGTGNDTYSYASGSGNLTIIETGGRNTIVLGSGISTGDVSLTASGHDLLITDSVSGDQITISGQLDVHAIVDALVFNGGTTWSLEGIELTMPSGASTLFGTPGDDTLTATAGTQTLVGNAGSDTFIGASGTEYLMANGWGGNNVFNIGTGVTTAYGGAGNDTYSFGSGSGLLSILEAGGQNTLAMGSGISSVTLAASGHDLIITDGVSSDTITLVDQLSALEGVQTLTFSGGGTQSLEGIALTANASVLYGTAGGDTLTATSGTQTISGNGGNDIFINATGSHTAIGGNGNDIYSYHSGDGLLVIQDNAGTDTVKLGTGISTGDVSLTASGHDLLITDSVSGDTITLKNQLSTSSGVSYLVFNGGTTQVLEGIALTSAASVLYGTAGSDTLTAASGTQTLTGNGGSDIFVNAGGIHTAIGASGNDIYSYHSGDGLLTIQDDVGNNTLKLGSGISTGDVSLAASGHDLIITDSVSGDTITLKNQLSTQQAITSLVFSGGTTQSLHSVTFSMPGGASILYGTVGNDTLTATAGTETLTGNGGNDNFVGASGVVSMNGGTGNDTFVGGTGTAYMLGNGGTDTFAAGAGTTTAWGGSGNDTYSYASGDGALKIIETGAGTDTLKLASGLTASNVRVYTSGGDLYFSDGTTGDLVTISNFYDFAGAHVETLVYGDATTTSLVNGLTATAQDGTTTLWGTNGNDTLIGGTGTMILNAAVFGASGGNDMIVAGIGNTTASGGSGDTIYSYAPGDGVLKIIESGGTDTLQLGAGITSSNISLSENSGGTDLIITDGTSGDQITLSNYIGFSFQRVEVIKFSDGSTLSAVITAASGNTTLNGTSGNDILAGSSGNQTINGAGASDTFIGGSGTQTLNGAGGANDTFVAATGATTAIAGTANDIYSFSSGSGLFHIFESGGTDTLKLGTGLTSSNVSMSENSSGTDLIITDGVSGDTITLHGHFQFSSDRIETLIYGDASTTSLVNNIAVSAASGTSTLFGTAGNDTLTATTGTQSLRGGGGGDTFIGGTGTQFLIGNEGTNGNNVFIAAAGSTTAWGGSGDDIYSYAAGNGALRIIETGAGTDTLKLASGLTASNVRLATNGSALYVSDSTGGDLITISSFFDFSGAHVETLVYGDSTSTSFVNGLTATAADGTSTLWGTTGNDTLIGGTGTMILDANASGFSGGNDLIVAGAGNTTAWGGSGDTIYSYAPGSGTMWIHETGGTDTLQLGAGITSSNIAFSENSSGTDLIITDGTSGDQITINNYIGFSSQRLEVIKFSDGSTMVPILIAASGNTTLNGTSGNDVLAGSSGTQTLNGNGGSDTFIGGSGTQYLLPTVGSGGNNLFISGTGTTSARGSTGSDIYSYAAGNGLFVVRDDGGTDTLKLATGLTAANITFSWDSTVANLSLCDGTSGDTITLVSNNVDILLYGDGSTMNLKSGAGVVERATDGTSTLIGTNSADTLIGGTGTTVINADVSGAAGGNDVLVAGTGTTTMYGGTGQNTYSYASGNGDLWIEEFGGTADMLKLASGLTSSNVSLSQDSTGSYLYVLDGVSGDRVQIYQHMGLTGTRMIETLMYGDGSTIGLTTALTLYAYSGNSTLKGTSGADTMIAVNSSGTETLAASTGNDVYSYAAGNGYVVISEDGGSDTIKLASGLTSSNLVFSQTNAADMLITDGTSGDQIKILSQILHLADQVEKIMFSDGSTMVITGGLTWQAQAGNTTLQAFAGTNTIIAAGSNSGTETLLGHSGSDTYSYHSGDGAVYISEGGLGGTDTLKLGSGLVSPNIFFSESSSGADLIITDNTSGDQITIKNAITTSTYRVETLVYGDGATLNLTTVKGAGSAATTLNGTTGNDIMIPNTGNLTLAGAGGNDLYCFGTGNGQDKINNGVSTANNANGTLFFGHGIGSDELWFDRVDDSGTISGSGNNLRVIIMGTTSSMTINGWYIGGSSTYKQLSEFELSDNGLMLDSQLSSLVSAMSTFETDYATAHGGTPFDPTSVSSITDTAVLSAVNSAWHS